MRTKEAWQVKAIFGLAKQNGIDSEELHALVYSLTGKESISLLSFHEANNVCTRLKELSGKRKPDINNTPKSVPGMITAEQQKLVFRLVYRLRELDECESTATIGDRVCGAMKKILGVSVSPTAMFAWITFDQGQILIEALKRYVRTAERRQAKNEQVRSAEKC